ncbi:MAG: LPS biosynthesis protein [Bacteroidota bacterium]
MIDDHPKECEAMRMFRTGQGKAASALQDEFLAEVKASGEDHCTCQGGCKFHGHCVECVILHRGHGDHLPNCFRNMVNRRIEALSELTEHTACLQYQKSEDRP